ncbi:hypothetical protein KUCAC02_005521, partial [Chaenocephalus aceratus]
LDSSMTESAERATFKEKTTAVNIKHEFCPLEWGSKTCICELSAQPLLYIPSSHWLSAACHMHSSSLSLQTVLLHTQRPRDKDGNLPDPNLISTEIASSLCICLSDLTPAFMPWMLEMKKKNAPRIYFPFLSLLLFLRSNKPKQAQAERRQSGSDVCVSAPLLYLSLALSPSFYPSTSLRICPSLFLSAVRGSVPLLGRDG